MNDSTLQLIKRGEGLTTEFKRTIDSTYKIAKTIVSFANTSGGVLLVGVGDNGEIRGIESELNELKKLEKAAGELIEKQIIPQFRLEIIDGKSLLRIEISESSDKPHVALNEKGERIIYIRVKDKSIPTPKMLIQRDLGDDLSKLLNSRHVRTLIQFLRENDFITVKAFSNMINISDKRSGRMLNDLADKQVLLKVVRRKEEFFSLKLRQ
jgi:predicted HTH transcriptional regulator